MVGNIPRFSKFAWSAKIHKHCTSKMVETAVESEVSNVLHWLWQDFREKVVSSFLDYGSLALVVKRQCSHPLLSMLRGSLRG